MSALSAPSCRWAAACFCLSFLILTSLWPGTGYSFPSPVTASGMMQHPTQNVRKTQFFNESFDAPPHHTLRFAGSSSVPYRYTVRISESGLRNRQALEQSIQLAAFAQFGSGKTGRIHNISVPAFPSAIIQVVRLRSGSFRRYGVTINEFRIPRGCKVNPIPERILLVYSQLVNSSLFQDLPQGYVLGSPVLFLLAYDATSLNRSQPLEPLNVSTTSKPISIQFTGSSGLKCASFDDDSTGVSYTDLVQGACQVTRFGAFALVRNAPVQVPTPLAAPMAALPRLPTSHSNAWKIIVGSVVGGLVVLVLISLLALGVANYKKKAKFARMEYQADNGETLQTTTIGNSRVPAAGGTRTQSVIEREYSV